MEQQVCACGCGNPVASHDGKGRPSKYFKPRCRKRAQRIREASGNVTKIDDDVTKIRNTIIQGDALEVLKQLPDQCVQCCVTSPPYYALRDYGAHGQIGLEKTSQAYIERLVAVFREVRRLLCDTGVLWLNIGDSYTGSGKGGSGRYEGEGMTHASGTPSTRLPGVKPKDLMMIPARLALALQEDDWWLRSDVIWHKLNAMPESVGDRPTSAHEHLFLLAKSERYFYDADAIREPAKEWAGAAGTFARSHGKNTLVSVPGQTYASHRDNREDRVPPGRNKRNVWSIASQPYSGAHFAVMPPKLAEPCILAGSRPGDVVLDPFMGSGTVAMVAKQQGRSYMGIELNPDYIRLAEDRLASVPLSLWQAGSSEEVG
jgi:DNA modification methylase